MKGLRPGEVCVHEARGGTCAYVCVCMCAGGRAACEYWSRCTLAAPAPNSSAVPTRPQQQQQQRDSPTPRPGSEAASPLRAAQPSHPPYSRCPTPLPKRPRPHPLTFGSRSTMASWAIQQRNVSTSGAAAPASDPALDPSLCSRASASVGLARSRKDVTEASRFLAANVAACLPPWPSNTPNALKLVTAPARGWGEPSSILRACYQACLASGETIRHALRQVKPAPS